MRFEFHLPLKFAGGRIQRVFIALKVAEEHQITAGTAAGDAAYDRRGAYAGVGVEAPIHAAGFGIQRINSAAGTGQEQPSADNDRLAIAAADIGH